MKGLEIMEGVFGCSARFLQDDDFQKTTAKSGHISQEAVTISLQTNILMSRTQPCKYSEAPSVVLATTPAASAGATEIVA